MGKMGKDFEINQKTYGKRDCSKEAADQWGEMGGVTVRNEKTYGERLWELKRISGTPTG